MFDAKSSCFRRLMVLAVAGALAPAVRADTLHVPKRHATIQAALDAARNGDVIVVAAGTYEGPGNHDLNFAGKAVTLRGDGGPGACIISLNASPTDPRRAVHFQAGETRATVFEGFTIRAGATPAGAVADMFNGAAILVQSAPTIRNCIFEDNHAGCWGGALTCSTGSPLIDGCTFRNNRADDDGGALFLWGDSHPVVINSLFIGNQAPVAGGAVANFGGVLTMTNCTFVNNDARWGYAIYSYQGSITNAVVWANTGDANSEQIEGNTLVTHSNVQGGRAGVGNINAAPSFVNAFEGDFRLAAGSRGIDEALNQNLPAGMNADLDGNPRIRDGDANQTDVVDMGAFEFQRPCPADWNADAGITSQDFFDFLGAFFAGAADFNASGATDSQDFFDFLAAFFTPCL